MTPPMVFGEVDLTPVRVRVRLPTTTTVAVVPVAGAPGPQGVPGLGSGLEYPQTTPLATWVIPVPESLGRRPNVAVYVDTGGMWELVEPDVTASATQVTVTFPSPVAGTAVLT